MNQPHIIYWANLSRHRGFYIALSLEGFFLFSKMLELNYMMNQKSQTGAIGEQAAANFLGKKDYEILDMNYKNNSGRRLGEIDIIARDSATGEIVFVEVKTRAGQKYEATLPEENITPSKLHKLAKIASAYLAVNDLRNVSYRFDAISVWLDFETRLAKIKHITHI
jgi:putative endonuclease